MKASIKLKNNLYDIYYSLKNENIRVNEQNVYTTIKNIIERSDGSLNYIERKINESDLNIYVYKIDCF